MKYVPPLGASDTDADFVDADPVSGIEGSPIPAAAIEHPQREIIATIEVAGLTPDANDRTQLASAINALITTHSSVAASDSVAGHVELATAAEVQAGTDNSKAVTPAGLLSAFQTAAQNFEMLPTGMPVMWPGLSVPPSCLRANGAAVSRTLYASLFDAIGTIYGVGDGIDTFNLPDWRGVFFRGLDDGRGLDPNRELGSYQADAVQNMTGTVWTACEWLSANGVFGGVANSGHRNTGVSSSGKRFNFDAARQVRTAHEARPKNVALHACIKY